MRDAAHEVANPRWCARRPAQAADTALLQTGSPTARINSTALLFWTRPGRSR
jgi:hypothetical protein